MKRVFVAVLVLLVACSSMVFAGGQSAGGGSSGAKRVAYIARAQGDSFAAWLANSVVVINGPAGNLHSTARRESWQKEFFALDLNTFDREMSSSPAGAGGVSCSPSSTGNACPACHLPKRISAA
jgi:hypothetical protein